MSTVQLKYIPLPTAVPAAGSTAEAIRVAQADDGFPCRRCQSNSTAGDKMRLISYNPFEDSNASRNSPFNAPGPIFVHDKDCTTYEGSELAESHRSRSFSVRGYDSNHMTMDVRLLDGRDVDKKVKEMFGNESLQYIHAHHALHGCFAFKIVRDL